MDYVLAAPRGPAANGLMSSIFTHKLRRISSGPSGCLDQMLNLLEKRSIAANGSTEKIVIWASCESGSG